MTLERPPTPYQMETFLYSSYRNVADTKASPVCPEGNDWYPSPLGRGMCPVFKTSNKSFHDYIRHQINHGAIHKIVFTFYSGKIQCVNCYCRRKWQVIIDRGCVMWNILYPAGNRIINNLLVLMPENFMKSANFVQTRFMSLIPNKKNKKDNRPGGGGIGNTKPNQQNQKVKVNTKGLSRNTKLTGGSQRGS